MYKNKRKQRRRHKGSYKTVALLSAIAIITQAIYPIIPQLPSFKLFGKNIVTANDDILSTGETEKVMFKNTNPEFKVEFGNKEQADKPFIRFEALGSRQNPFDKEKNAQIKESIFERLSSTIFGEKEHGIEFGLESAGTDLRIPNLQPPMRLTDGQVSNESDNDKEITKQGNNTQLTNENQNHTVGSDLRSEPDNSAIAEQKGSSHSPAGEAGRLEPTEGNNNFNGNDNKTATHSNANDNKDSAKKKKDKSANDNPLGTLILNGTKSESVPSSIGTEKSELAKGSWEKDTTVGSDLRSEPDNSAIAGQKGSSHLPTGQVGGMTTEGQDNNGSNGQAKTDQETLEIQAELKAEEQIYNQLEEQLDQMIFSSVSSSGESPNNHTVGSDLRSEPDNSAIAEQKGLSQRLEPTESMGIMSPDNLQEYRERLKQQILDQLTKEQEAKAPTQTAQIENPEDKNSKKDIVKNPDFVPGIDAEYRIMEEKGLKEEIVIKNNDGFSKECMQKEIEKVSQGNLHTQSNTPPPAGAGYSSQEETGIIPSREGSSANAEGGVSSGHCSLPKNVYTFSLKLDPGVVMHHAIGATNQKPHGITYFTDEKGKYLFHFSPLYAEDAKGVRTNAVRLEIKEMENGQGMENGELTSRNISENDSEFNYSLFNDAKFRKIANLSGLRANDQSNLCFDEKLSQRRTLWDNFAIAPGGYFGNLEYSRGAREENSKRSQTIYSDSQGIALRDYSDNKNLPLTEIDKERELRGHKTENREVASSDQWNDTLSRKITNNGEWRMDNGENPESNFPFSIFHFPFKESSPFIKTAKAEEASPEGKKYEMRVIVDLSWLLDPARQYPIRIDPSIVHDTEVEFDAGNALNRVESLSDPRVDIKSSTGDTDFGNGADGVCAVTSGTTNLNTGSCAGKGTADAVNFSVTANTSAGQNQVTTSATPTGLAAGDEILIINLMGTSGDYANVGKYETKRITSINSNTLNLSANLTYSYDGTTQKIMVQRVPNYTTVTVDNGTTLTIETWDGSKNGVLFFRATGAVTNNGTINIASKGFRGGGSGSSSGPESYKGNTAAGGASGGAGGKGGYTGSSNYYYCTSNSQGGFVLTYMPSQYTCAEVGYGSGEPCDCASDGCGGYFCNGTCQTGTSYSCSSASVVGTPGSFNAGGGGGGGGTAYCSAASGGAGGSRGGGGGGGDASGGAGQANGSGGGGAGYGGGGGGGGGSSFTSITNTTALTSNLIQLGGGASAGAGGGNGGAAGQNGAGGSGGNSYAGTAGSPGGGIAYIAGFTLALNSGTINATGGNGGNGTNGTNGTANGGGGGGGGSGADGASGGTVVLKGNAVILGTVTATGGNGGSGGTAGSGSSGGNGGAGATGSTGGNGVVGVYYKTTTSGSSNPTAAYYQNLPSYRYGEYDSSVLDLTSGVSSIDSLQWAENGVRTGDGETPYLSTGLVSQWNFNEASGTTAANNAGASTCGGTATNCDFTLNNFASTGSRDAAVMSGWTADNKRWGDGALMFSGAATADSLSRADITGNVLDPNSSDLTIETWIKTNDLSAEIFSNNNANGTACTNNGYYLGIDASGYPIFNLDTNGATAGCDASITATTKVNDGAYHHLAVSVTRGIGAYIYLDGALVGFDASVTSYSGITVTGIIYMAGPAGGLDGVVDAAKFYSRALAANEVLSDAQAGNIEFETRTGADATPDDGSWEAWKPTTSESQLASMDSDSANWDGAYDGYTKLLLHNDGANNSTSFSDKSLFTKTVTASGDAKVSTAQSKFGGSAAYFDGTGDYLSTPDSDDWNFGNGDFTIDCWAKRTQSGVAEYLVAQDTDNVTSNHSFSFFFFSDNTVWFSPAVGSDYYAVNSGATTISDTNWHHYVGVRSGANLYLFIDGQQVGTRGDLSTLSLNNSDQPLVVGQSNYSLNHYYFNGYIDEVRVSKGIARWTSNFTPPSATYFNPGLIQASDAANPKVEGNGSMETVLGTPSAADGNTVGLWHMDETGGSGAYIKDATANGNNGTPTGTTLVEGISGKARSFNGSSDKIDILFTWPSGDFTVEMWIYPKAWGASPSHYQRLLHFYDGSVQWQAYADPTQGLNFDNAAGTGARTSSATNIPSTNNWTLLTLVKNGSSYNIYYNGVAQSTTSAQAGNPSPTTQTLRIGADISGTGADGYFNGSIDEVRISNSARSADGIAEAYRMGRDHRLSRTIGSADLSSKTKLPFWVAGDRTGTYLEATAGESAYANGEPDANTVGLWHLEESTGSGAYLKDSSTYGNNATPTGTSYTDGKIGKGRNFNGTSDYISAPNSSSWEFGTGDFTLDWWEYRTDNTNGKVAIARSNTDPYTPFLAGYSSGGDHLAFYATSDGSGWDIASDKSMGPVSLNQWVHLAVVRSGNNWYTYKNGVQQDTWSSSAAIRSDSNPFQIGRWTWSATPYYYSGYIDEVRVSKGTARTADQIRQTFEAGKRSHPITIDFQAKLDSGNLITGSGDTSFTVDDTPYLPTTNKADTLYIGDKVIVKENYDGTEYLAQGTVTAVTASTGAATVAAWDAGSTFPASGFTADAGVFKWQKEWMDVTAPLGSQMDAVTRLTLRCTDGSEGRTVYLDDFESGGPYLTAPAATGNVTSTVQRYMQYRAIISTSNLYVSPYLSGVTVNYTAGPTTDQLMRHGRYFSSGSLQGFWWAK